jgi:hypothetical protein
VLLNTRLTPAEVVRIARTGDRTPEVVIKVMGQGGRCLQAVQQHFEDIHKGRNRALETDDGEPVRGKQAAKSLPEDWDLDLEALLSCRVYFTPMRRRSPKLVHKLMFSMPAGTPPDKLLAAVRNFLREDFARHRYALALHTDEPHPHVHVVVKAVSEESMRLNIRKATLRHWRQEFARHLRAQGVAANATRRAAYAEKRRCKLHGIYRPVNGRPRSGNQFPIS